MDALVYYLIALPFIFLVSLLPFPVLYLLSDFLFFILFYCVGYRKKVILANLRNAFPEKSEAEINTICKSFYHYLCDLVFEVVKVTTISKKAMLRRCKFDPASLAMLSEYAAEGKSIILVMGHLGNWEWAGHPFSLLCRQQLYVIYHPLKSKYFEALMLRMRGRFGTRMMPMKTAFKEMLAHKARLTATVFIADQTPMPENAYWTKFLNQDTAVFKGTELIARKMNLPVIYSHIKKEKRGYYTMYTTVLTDNPAATTDGEISEMHIRRLEQDIIANPDTWLWSHRRWKHKCPHSQLTPSQTY